MKKIQGFELIMTIDNETPLAEDMAEGLGKAILFTHKKITRWVEDFITFISEAKIEILLDECLIVGVIFVGIFFGIIETLWRRRKRRRNERNQDDLSTHHKEDKGKTSSVEDLISRSRMVVEEASDLEEIRTALQNELNQSVERRVEGVRVRIKSKKEEMQQRLEAAEVGLDNFNVLTNFLLRMRWSRSWRCCVPSTRRRRRR